jgi:hypothetical protein
MDTTTLPHRVVVASTQKRNETTKSFRVPKKNIGRLNFVGGTITTRRIAVSVGLRFRGLHKSITKQSS